MKIELVEGPMDGEIMDVMEGIWEYYIVKPPSGIYNFLAFDKEYADTYPVLIRGTYKRKFGTKDFYWQGWEDEVSEQA